MSSFADYTEPLITKKKLDQRNVTARSNNISPAGSTSSLLARNERFSDLIYRYTNVISAIEEIYTEIRNTNVRRSSSSDTERLQWTIYLRDCSNELRSAIEKAEELVECVHQRFVSGDGEDDSSLSSQVKSLAQDKQPKSSQPKKTRIERHKREFWDQVRQGPGWLDKYEMQLKALAHCKMKCRVTLHTFHTQNVILHGKFLFSLVCTFAFKS